MPATPRAFRILCVACELARRNHSIAMTVKSCGDLSVTTLKCAVCGATETLNPDETAAP